MISGVRNGERVLPEPLAVVGFRKKDSWVSASRASIKELRGK